MLRVLVRLGIGCAASFAAAGMASAQMNNQPYAFKSFGGMGLAGKQAIIGQKIGQGSPDNLFRDDFGKLVVAKRGPGGVALLPDHTGSRNVGRARRAFAAGEAGQFNSFFVKFDGLPFRREEGSSSAATVDGWTANVHGYVMGGDNSVDVWTGMVYSAAY